MHSLHKMLVKFNLKMLRLHICESTIMQVEEECGQTIFYLKGCSYPKLYYNKMNILIRNQRRIQLAVQKEKPCAECGVRLKTSVYQSYCVFALSFQKKSQLKSKV